MKFSFIAIGLVVLAAAPKQPEFEIFDGVAYPVHATSAGRADHTPVESIDVTYPDVHAAFDKDGPPGPGVDIVTDRNVYGTNAMVSDREAR